MSNRNVRNNEKSLLLSDQENESIFNLLGKGCQSLSTAVGQLFLSEDVSNQMSVGDEKQIWTKKGCGVVCFIKDNTKRSYFIRLYDPVNLQMIWEQELYTHFKYNTQKEFFHTFEADNCQAGLNFASEDEADKFQEAVQGKLSDMHNKRMERKKREDREGARDRMTEKLDPEMKALCEELGLNESLQVNDDTIDFIYDFAGKHGGIKAVREDIARQKPPAVPPPPTERKKREDSEGARDRMVGRTTINTRGSAPTIIVGETPLYKTVGKTVRDTAKVENEIKGKSKKKITKRDNSSPTQFRHVAHAGWDQEKIFKTEKLDPEMKALCEELGLYERSQVDKDTIDFIYDFAGKYGGIKAVREDIARQKSPAVPPPPTDQGHAHTDKGTYPLAKHKIAALDPPGKNNAPSLPQRPAQPTVVPPPIPRRYSQNSRGIESSIPQSPPPDIPDAPAIPPPTTNPPPPPPLEKSADTSSPPTCSGRAGLLDAIVNFRSSTLSNVRSEKNVRKHVTPICRVLRWHCSSTYGCIE